MKNKKLVTGLVVGALVIGGGTTYGVHAKQVADQKAYEAKVSKQVKSIQSDYSKFVVEKSDDVKLKELKALITKQEKDKTDEKKIKKAYQTSVVEARKFFTDKNQKALEAATIKDLGKASLADLKGKIDELTGLDKTVQAQGLAVYENDKVLKEFQGKIAGLKTSYAKKTDELNAKAKSEAEKAKQAAEAAAQAQKEAEVEAAGQVASQAEGASGSQQAKDNNYAGNGYTQQATTPSYQAPAQQTPAPSAPSNSTGGHDYRTDSNGNVIGEYVPGGIVDNNGNFGGWQ